jgi:hypothetical protein
MPFLDYFVKHFKAETAENRKLLLWCRLVNLALGGYIVASGVYQKDPLTVASGIACILTDTILIASNFHATFILQVIRLISATIVGPYLLFAQNDVLVKVMGALLIAIDGTLYVVENAVPS